MLRSDEGTAFTPNDDAIAVLKRWKSPSSKMMKRNACRHRSVAELGFNNSAIPTTGPDCVKNMISTKAPGQRGLESRSNPPVTDTS